MPKKQPVAIIYHQIYWPKDVPPTMPAKQHAVLFVDYSDGSSTSFIARTVSDRKFVAALSARRAVQFTIAAVSEYTVLGSTANVVAIATGSVEKWKRRLKELKALLAFTGKVEYIEKKIQMVACRKDWRMTGASKKDDRDSIRKITRSSHE